MNTTFANNEIWSVPFIIHLFNVVKVSAGKDIGNIANQNLSRYFGLALVDCVCKIPSLVNFGQPSRLLVAQMFYKVLLYTNICVRYVTKIV